MSYPIKFLSLQKAELQYEVELRGGVGESVQELRKQIVKLSQLLPSEDILESHLDPVDDLKEAKESLLKSQSNLTNLKSRIDKNLLSRTETLLHHIYHRINRIEVIEEVRDLHKVCTSSLNSQLKELSTLKPSSSNPKPLTSVTDTTIDPSTLSVTCERSVFAEITKLKYSGKTCVHSFIQKVEEFVQARGISFEKILSLAYEIFTDDALHWFRYNKNRINSWHELCVLLKEDFSSNDYDYRLMSEIRSRTQGDQENITIYFAIMHGMFSRLSKSLSENDKLDILMHNIRPCYANTLAASPCIKSIDDLKSVCRNYETIKSRFSQFHEPPKLTSSTLAPEFAYKSDLNYTKFNQQPKYNNYNKPYNQKNNYIYTPKHNSNYKETFNSDNTNLSKDNGIAAISTEVPRTVFCPRCRSNSHSLGACRQKRFPICFRCGKKDVRYPDCPDCNGVHSKDEPSKN